MPALYVPYFLHNCTQCINSFTLYVPFFFKIARSVYINSALTVLAFHCRGMLEMVSLQKNSNSQIFLCNR